MCALDLTRGNRDAASVADDVLITRAAHGDADAFGLLMAERMPGLLRLARTIVRNEADARDATQEPSSRPGRTSRGFATSAGSTPG